MWRATLVTRGGARGDVTARALVNAAGPWVREVLTDLVETPIDAQVRHVKGSHIVVPRVHDEQHAYILQNADNRIVFIIPYQDRYSLIGTTDVPVQDFEHPAISEEETYYLLTLANTYLARPLASTDVVWTYSGVRPLYDDGTSDPSAVTRDYVLKLDPARDGANGPRAPVLSIFGGKITTYRKLAEAALATLAPFFPAMGHAWTHDAALPGGDIPQGDRNAWLAELVRRYPALAPSLLQALAHRHGTRVATVLGDARSAADLGENFGADLTAREIAYLRDDEWACTAEDVLWRRTKCGLPMTLAQRDRVAAFMGA
jgi:D-erythritol 1-phosphate dehydrogenase